MEGRSGRRLRRQEGLLMVGAWWRAEVGADSAVKKVSDNWSTMGFGV